MNIISLVDYVSLTILTANFDDGGVFFRFCLYKSWASSPGLLHMTRPTIQKNEQLLNALDFGPENQ